MNELIDLPLFNHPEPLTEAAIAEADKHASEAWKLAALDVVRRVASRNEYFTGDDVWDAIDADESMPLAYHAPGALGGVMRRARTEGLMELVGGKYVESRRPTMHRKPMRVWRSKLTEAD